MTTLSDYFPSDEIDDLIEPVCQLADLDTSKEGGHSDPLMDELIVAARKVRDREGFLVVEGDEPTDEELQSKHRIPGVMNWRS
jgi:hypothetical protein